MLLSVIMISPVTAGAYTSGDFGYLVKSGKAVIYSYYGKKSDLVVPAKLGGYKVTSIDEKAFAEHSFRKVTISKGIKKIGGEAFRECGISELKLPSTITTIASEAFAQNNFETVTLPKKAVNLGESVFDSCRKLKKVTLSSKLTKIPKNLFCNCRKLKTVKLPSTLKSIGEGAFAWCVKLEKVTFPAKLTKIGESAFTICTSLKKVKLPYSLKEIGNHAFCDCMALSEITVPDGVTKIGSFAFGYCEELMGDESTEHTKNDPFTVKAYKNSSAATYAKDNELTYKELKAPTKVKLNKKSAKLKVGKTLKLKATLKSKKATTVLAWKSSNKKIVSVSSKGKVKAKKRGSAVITVKTHNGKKAKCKITVK